jgi:hypothetical protein
MTTFAQHSAAFESFLDCVQGGAGKDAIAGCLAENVVLIGPNLPETAAQGEADLTGAGGQVEQSALAARLGPFREIIDHALRVGHPEALVVPGGPPVQVAPELRIAHGSGTVRKQGAGHRCARLGRRDSSAQLTRDRFRPIAR